MNNRWKAILAGMLIIVVGSVFAFANEKGNKDEAAEVQALAKEAKISMAIALDSATKLVPGTVLKGELEKEDGIIIYSFEILPSPDSKIIKEISIDAISGTVVKQEDENLFKKGSEEKKGFHKKDKKKSHESEKDEDND